MAARTSLSRIGFMLTCFLLPGLIGTFASFSIPAPVVDEMHQQAALDAVLDAATPAARKRAIDNLQNATDADTAAMVTAGTAPLPNRVEAATANMRAEVLRQARGEAYLIRLMVITMTVLSAVFGVAILGSAKPAPSEPGSAAYRFE